MRFIAVLIVSISIFSFAPMPVLAEDIDQAALLQKIDNLTKELESLKQQVQELKKKDEQKEEKKLAAEQVPVAPVGKAAGAKPKPSPFSFSGDYRFRYDYLAGRVGDHFNLEDVLASKLGGPAPQLQKGFNAENSSLLMNRLGLNFKVQATQDIALKTRFLMYKVWGHDTAGPVTGGNGFFFDRMNIFDGNVSHVPEDSILRVDQAYIHWAHPLGLSNVAFSVGRRPSTGGVPGNLRENQIRRGTSGVTGLLVDYAFDGLTLSYKPLIKTLPGSFVKLCAGRGFESGFRDVNNGLKDSNMAGINITGYSTDNFRAEFQYARAFDIYAFPETSTSNIFGKNKNLGDMDELAAVVMGKRRDIGPGDLNLFLSGGMNISHPNGNVIEVPVHDTFTGTTVDEPVAGLLYDAGGSRESRTGYAVYLGERYDFKPTLTKVGLEYNHGSKYWTPFIPAADDIWTGKLGARGNVYEVYLIQELKQKPITKFGKAYFRLGYQYYDFDFTGTNDWVGEPKGMSSLNNPANAQIFAPVKSAQDAYLTLDVEF